MPEPTAENGPSPARSANMASIGSRDTAPELAVRRLLHRLGYRFRLHRADLPGTPDICFPLTQEAGFRSRLFLAPARRLPKDHDPEDAHVFLEGEV